MKIEVLYQDEDLIIVNKPPLLLTIPDRFDGTLPALNKLVGNMVGAPVLTVHRLDRETSGAICFAKHEESHRYMSQLFEAHEVDKLYAGLVSGIVEPEQGTVEAPIVPHPGIPGKMMTAKRGKESKTDYRVVRQWRLHSLLQFRIHTGRTHQIRVHMQSIGHPILCDEMYGDGKPFRLSSIKKNFKLSKHDEQETPLLSRLALHAYQLHFFKADGTEVLAEAELPKDMSAVVKQLDKWQPSAQS